MLSANILYDTHDFSRLCGTDSTTLAVKVVPFGASLLYLFFFLSASKNSNIIAAQASFCTPGMTSIR